MFTEKRKSATSAAGRGRGRPPGETARGKSARQRLYQIAIQRITHLGYEATTLRDVAREAGVSVGLLYRYFPSKQAVVLAFYDDLSRDYAMRAQDMPPGTWLDRFLFALRTSLAVLTPQRLALSALVPVLIGDPRHGLFAAETMFSRERVQSVFVQAVCGATDSLTAPEAMALGRLLYLVHLTVILWWLLDKSPNQQATAELMALMARLGPLAALAVSLPATQEALLTAERLVELGLFGVVTAGQL